MKLLKYDDNKSEFQNPKRYNLNFMSLFYRAHTWFRMLFSVLILYHPFLLNNPAQKYNS